jgi:hypothetical protein
MSNKDYSSMSLRSYVMTKSKEKLDEKRSSSKKPVVSESKNKSEESFITPDVVKHLAMEVKSINESISIKEPLAFVPEKKEAKMVSESKEVVSERPKKTLKIGTYENVGIEIEGDLMESIKKYNRSKSLTHGNDSEPNRWKSLTNYERFEEKP